ncbi:D-alanyl-D-alanine carboxypeptidase [Zobellella denitrificans]|jgi:D-alanyl-D-alanine carboxypeptidase|uniref:D-alanyl-D-alanine carboxypeptidase n=1 Tax=Zobellella denitrificans TaxID=347534 RepID=A0A231MV25_9GAMM|nr:serine hydrolase [Zobellella denitrificans]ATG75280.1 D-alanyl-D-alanine carboxypeptidase [Zobellella denitrificans]OXS14067.1 D-alanyl-D-alanine carboxypeptidase [Zobellella denitrificans]
MFAVRNAGKAGFLFLAVLLLYSLFNQAQANPRYASIVLDADSGEVLHASNADATRYPASLTKMMTLYMLFESMEKGLMTLDTAMPVSAHAASMPQTNISLKAGDRLKVRDAIPALIVRSANDVASVVAEALGGTERAFGAMMTEKAKAMKMTSTTFRNASGLPDAGQTTTARDLAILSVRLMKDFPQYYHYFSTQSFTYKGRTYTSHNRMIRNYAGVDGMKTGFIRASGFNVATSAVKDGRRLIGVVMGGQTAQSRDAHMASLLDRGFERATQLAKASPEATRPAANLVVSTDTVRQVVRQEQPVTRAPAVLQRTSQTFPVEQTMITDELGWAVQIGSFRVPEQARERASDAARRLADVELAQIAVSEVEISNRKLFRARLVGLQEGQAKSACQRLSRQGMDCLVVRLSGS